MFGAVAAHKFVIAFCIGVELIASRTRRYLSVIYVVTFAVVSPIGIGVGMLLVGGGSAAASGPMAVILQASFAIWASHDCVGERAMPLNRFRSSTRVTHAVRGTRDKHISDMRASDRGDKILGSLEIVRVD